MMSTPSSALPPGELSNEFAWSWSRHEHFYQCPRRLYWQHYGSWSGWEIGAPAQAALAYRLKKLKSVAMLVGSTLHEVVSEQLRLRPEAPAEAPIAQIQAEIERRVLKQMRESRNRDWERFKNPKRYAMLFEDYYGPGIDERGQDAALGTVRSAVNGLAASKYARRAFAVPKERIRIIDPTDFGEMKIRIDDVPVYASPDLVVEDDRGNLHVVDWKTGTPAKANVAQLAVYGLYVAEKLGAPLERITAHLVYLRTGDVHVYANLREGVAEARRRIATYTADVRSRLTDVENNVAADAALFPMTENRALCRRCNFQEICGRVAPKPEPPVEEADDL